MILARGAAPARTSRRVWVALALALGWVACGDEGDGGQAGNCACPDNQCPAELCNFNMDLPASCDAELFEVQLRVDGTFAEILRPGHSGPTCTATIAAGGQAEISLGSPSNTFAGLSGTASCPTGGETVPSPFCSLRFELAESCRDRLSVPAADVVVDGLEVGQVTVDAPLVPCVLVPAGSQVTGTIRAGTAAVLTAPLNCFSGGNQASLMMECAE